MGKAVICICVIGICSLIGMGKSAALTARVKTLDDVLLMIQKMEACLRNEKMTTAEVIGVLSNLDSMRELPFLENCREQLERGVVFPIAWKSALSELGTLSQDDIGNILLIGDVLGSTDAENQINELGVISELISQCRAEAKTNAFDKGKLYRSLGVLGGVGLSIMII